MDDKLNEKDLRNQILELVETYSNNFIGNSKFIPNKSHVPAAGKVIDSAEVKNIVESALDGWLTTGRFNAMFEKKLGEFLGIKHVSTVNSGSSANLLALTALTSPKLGHRALKPGDEVITVSAGFPTTVNPIVQNGLVPVFVDVTIPTYNINTALIEDAITSKTKAIMIAHTLGNPFNLDKIMEIVNKYDLWLIEDCCDSLGSKYKGQYVGTFGHLATYSFYPAHHITMGEGGAVVTNDHLLSKLVESFRDWGRSCFCKPGCDNTCGHRYDFKLGSLPAGFCHKYTYDHVGYNLKITDMQAACGLAQLDKLPGFIEQRKANFNYLKAKLEKFKPVFILPEPTENSDPSWFGFPITLTHEFRDSRLSLLKYLDSKNIGTRLLFGGNLIRQPYFEELRYTVGSNLENTDTIMNQTFWLGIYPGLTIEHLDYVVASLEEYFGL